MAMQTRKAWIWGLLFLFGGVGAPLWAQAAAGGEDLIEVRGKVYDENTDASLAGIWVRARVREGQEAAREIGGRTQTDADGRWAIRVPRPVEGQRSVTVQLISEHYGAVEVSIKTNSSGPVRALVPIGLRPGVRLSGRVACNEGSPLEIAEPELVNKSSIFRSREAKPIAPDPLAMDALGNFTYPWALAPGEWTLRSTSHVTTSPPLKLSHLTKEAYHEMRLDSGELHTFGGRVFDTAGRPLKRVRLLVYSDDEVLAATNQIVAVSDESGNFEVSQRFARGATLHGWRVRALGWRAVPHLGQEALDQAVTWGEEHARIELPASGTLRVRAKQQSTDESVEEFEVLKAELRKNGHPSPFEPVAQSLVTTGVAEIHQTGMGTAHLLIVRAKDKALGLSLFRHDFSGDTDTELVVELLPTAVRRIAVKSEDGKPLRGAEVAISLRGPAGLGAALASKTGAVTIAPEQFLNWLEGTTDDQGLFAAAVPVGCEAAVTVTAEGYVSASFAISTEGLDEPMRCLMRPGATVKGRIEPQAWVERLQRIRASQAESGLNPELMEGIVLMSRADVPETPPSLGSFESVLGFSSFVLKKSPTLFPLTIDRTGRFECSGIPAGEWILRWRFCRSFEENFSFGVPVNLSGTLVLAQGETKELSIDLSGLWPTKVSLELLSPSERTVLGQMALSGYSATPIGARAIDFELDWRRDGKLRVGEVLPGTYYLRIDEDMALDHFSMDLRLGWTPMTLPLPIRVPDPKAGHHKIAFEVKRDLKINLLRKSDEAPIKGLGLFRRFSEQDPGDWLSNCNRIHEPDGTVQIGPGPFRVRALAKGQHLIYIPRKKAQANWSLRTDVGWPILRSPDDPILKDLIFLGTIDVQSDGQSFTLLVPDEAGWL